jgi:N-acylglucosamine 2-epimerase
MTGLSQQRVNELIVIYRDELLKSVLPFWTRHGVDHQCGGFLTCLDRDGTLIDTDKGCWQQGRAAWLFGELYNRVEQRAEWLQLAQQGIDFLDQHAFDPADGRMWFQLTREGQPIRKRRYAFTESFAAIAYGELAQATGRPDLAEKARRTFLRFVEHHGQTGQQEPKYTSWRATRGIGVPMITINAAQELRDSIGLEDADRWIDESIETIRRYHVKADIQCVMETVDLEGKIIDHFDGRTLNPGHAIELAWFVMWEGNRRQDSELIGLGTSILDWMWHRGWDPRHGGMLYFVDVKGLPPQEYWHDMKFWWPHNETIMATLLAYLLTGDPRYAQWHTDVHRWAYQHFPDREYGEWFGYLHRDGTLSVPLKGNLWKGPFHLPRMLLNCWRWLSAESVAGP